MPQPMTIGALAKAAGVNVETVRYYQRRGLIATPPKALGGQRRYTEAVLRQIAFIRRAQALGFTLDEVAGLLKAAQSPASHGDARDIAAAKLDELRARQAELNRIVKQLKELVDACDANRRKDHSPMIGYLNGEQG